MACDDPINKTKHISFDLKERTPYDPTTQALHPQTREPIDLTGYTFESRFLDRDPDAEPVNTATVLETAAVSIVGAPANGIYKELLSEADNDALMLLDVPPTWWEFFAILDGVRHKWLTADVGLEFAGDDAP